MPVLAAAVVALPAHLSAVQAGDVDGDGVDEVVLVSRQDRGATPASVTLHLMEARDGGLARVGQPLALGSRARLWDIQGGSLWTVEGDGVHRLAPDGSSTRIHALTTPLAGLGPTTPASADFAHDLDQDGDAELLVWSRGQVVAVADAGTVHGTVKAPAQGALRSRQAGGGSSLAVTTRVPPMSVADLDGDGVHDLLFPERQRLVAWYTGTEIGARSESLALPFDLDPPDDQPIDREGEQRRVASAWFEDLDGRGGAELVAHRIVTNGSWFGSTAEIVIGRRQGASIAVHQSLETEAAAVDVRTVDFDGDGDKDLLVPQIDAGVANLASGLLSKTVRVDAVLYVMEDGRYGEPVALGKLKIPIDRSDTFQVEVEADVDGDGIVDLVTNDGEDVVRVYKGRRYAFDDQPLAEVAVPVPAGEGTLFVHDLTGDGRAEILVWGPDARQGHLLSLR